MPGGSVEGDKLPEGVEVVSVLDSKILLDNRHDYEIEVGNVLVKENNNELTFYLQNGLPTPEFVIETLPNLNNKDLEGWLSDYHERELLLFYNERELFEGNYLAGYKIKEEGDPTVYSYYFRIGEEIVIIRTPNPGKYEKVIKTLKNI